MRGLIVRNFLEVVVEGVLETRCDEVGLRVIGETFTIELVLEMLKGESVVENANCDTSNERRDKSRKNDRPSVTPPD